MQVKDLMTTKVINVKPETSISEVADLLHSRRLSGIPVVNESNIVLGLITEKELFSADAKLYLPTYVKILKETDFVIGGHKSLPYVAEQITRTVAKDIMNQDVAFVRPELGADDLAEIFSRLDQNPIPVTDESNHLVGIVSRSDLVKLLVNPKMPKSVSSRELHKHTRPIDEELTYVHKDISSRFAYVAKARANMWLTATVVLFVIGFIAGIVYVADPNIFAPPGQNSFDSSASP
jgi:predicted transcriptional regulator